MTNDKWDQRFLALAAHIATWSKDTSTKVGAVITGPNREIRGTGYNGFPPGVNDDDPKRHERPAKYLYTAHAEENAVSFAARYHGILTGCTLYSTLFPCAACARHIINSGIHRVVAPRAVRTDWAEQHEAARAMFQDVGITIHEV